jgi:hypothetical protein
MILNFIKKYLIRSILKLNVLMALQVYYIHMKVVKQINLLFFFKAEACVVIKLWQKLSKIVIKEVKLFSAAVLFGLKLYKVKDIFLLILRKINLLTGLKLFLDIVMELFTKDLQKHL